MVERKGVHCRPILIADLADVKRAYAARYRSQVLQNAVDARKISGQSSISGQINSLAASAIVGLGRLFILY